MTRLTLYKQSPERKTISVQYCTKHSNPPQSEDCQGKISHILNPIVRLFSISDYAIYFQPNAWRWLPQWMCWKLPVKWVINIAWSRHAVQNKALVNKKRDGSGDVALLSVPDVIQFINHVGSADKKKQGSVLNFVSEECKLG